jgi:uncharacterized protein (TIGR02453 family)
MKDIFSFLEKLEKNNNREWFQAHKSEFDSLNKSFIDFVSDLIIDLSSIDPALKDLQAKKCVFRIYRDVRFSPNKQPYKTHFSAYFSSGGKSSQNAGYYVHLDPKGSFFAAGVWMPEKDVLNAIRQELYFNLNSFEQIFKNKVFKKHFSEIEGEQLKTKPKGFDVDHPSAPWLKYKSFIVNKSLSAKDLPDFKVTRKLVSELAQSAKPLVDFLNHAIDLSVEVPQK